MLHSIRSLSKWVATVIVSYWTVEISLDIWKGGCGWINLTKLLSPVLIKKSTLDDRFIHV